jgi:DDE superfamily endonuclease
MTVDGTDFRIQEPQPFSTKWFTKKFNGPGLRYEVAVSIRGGDIVHTNGPFECGRWPDIAIFRNNLIDKLLPGEMVEADKGYRGEKEKIRTPDDYISQEDRNKKRLARARHETVNKRFKDFGILKVRYRHNLRDHQAVFRAIVVITQLSINKGEVVFHVEY